MPYGGVFRVEAKSQHGSDPGDSPAALMCSVGGLFYELGPGLASESPAADYRSSGLIMNKECRGPTSLVIMAQMPPDHVGLQLDRAAEPCGYHFHLGWPT